jgi:hypothetical protein
VADHCCDLVPRKKGRPARNDPRFRPKYPNSGTTAASSSSNGDNHNYNTANNTNNTNASTPSTLGTSDSDMETPSSRHLSDGLSSGSERDAYQHHQHHHRHHMYDQHIDDLPYTDADYDDDDDEEEEESAEEARRRRHWGQRRDEPAERPRAAESPSDLASRVIAMMADEMHKLRKENAKLRCKVKKLRKHKRAREEEEEEPNTNYNHHSHSYNHSHNNHNRSTCPPGSTNPKRPRYDEAPAMAAAPQPQPQLRPVETQPSAVVAGECVGLMEARKHMPFLNHYRMSADVPLVVGDISAYGHVPSSLVFMGLIADR